MSIIAGFNNTIEGQNELFGNGSVFYFFNQASSYAFIVFNLFSAPCFSAISAMGRELKSFGATFKAILFQTMLAWGIAVIIYNIGRIFI